MFYVITGPSGSGKSVLLRRVLEEIDNLSFSVSHTTRPRRSLEEDGLDYHFIRRDEFEEMVERDGFLEWAEVHGHLYGTSREEIEIREKTSDVVLDIDVQGARQIRSSGREAVFIFVVPPGFEELKRRLESRGQDEPSVILRRLKNAQREILEYRHFEFIIINDDLDTAVKELSAVIISRRCSLFARGPALETILSSFRSGAPADEEEG